MKLTFSNNPLSKFDCWLCNTYEKFTHWYWNLKPHHVTCKICGEIINSKDDNSPSPEECGWRIIKGSYGYGWICHSCDSHRNFRPYVKLVDLDERIRYGMDGIYKYELNKERNELLEHMKG